MKSVVIHAEGSVRVEERPIPQIQGTDDVLVRIVCSGLCGSDIPRIFAKGAHYYPITLGHEFSGYVAACGDSVKDLKPVFPVRNVRRVITRYVKIISSSARVVKAATRSISS